jgi:hypothetical protein
MAQGANSSYITRSSDSAFLIGHPLEYITGARLPSGRYVMCNFVFYHLTLKMTITDTARLWSADAILAEVASAYST